MLRRLLLFTLLALLSTAGWASAAAPTADWTGSWSFTDNCTGGGCAGQSYFWSGNFTQTGTTVTGTGIYAVAGQASGNSLSFTATGFGGYVARFTVTMSSDGRSLSGTATDTLGQSFTITGSGSGTPAPPLCGPVEPKELRRARFAHQSNPSPIVCPTAPVKTDEDKADAEANRRDYTNRRLVLQGLSAVAATAAAGAAVTPGGQPWAVAWGVVSGIFAMSGVAMDAKAEQWARIAVDPPSPRFRDIAAPPETDPSRLPLAGVPASRKPAIRAYVAAQLRLTALSVCVVDAIDRGAGALEAGEAGFASRQFAAGAACAREGAKLSERLPALVAPVAAYIRRAEQANRRLGVDPDDAGTARVRRTLVAKFAAVQRAVDLPADQIAAVRRGAVGSIGASTPSSVAAALVKEAQASAADATALRATAASLEAASGR